jgi:hypothetical protein
VALIDLNLLGNESDRLGEDLLGRLQRDWPSMPRIALTGTPPGAAKSLIVDYGLYDLLLKKTITLAQVRKVVRGALESGG